MATSIREIGENIKDSEEFTGTILYDEPLAGHTTMQVGGPAPLVVEPADVQSLLAALLLLKKGGAPVIVLGGGSNVVVDDGGVQAAVVVTTGLKGLSVKPGSAFPFQLEDCPGVQEAASVTVRCGAGVTIGELNDWCARLAITGTEQFAGLPGTCGGAAYMNARCYEKDFSELVDSVEYVDLDALPVVDDLFGMEASSFIQTYRTKDEGNAWGYKDSPFRHRNAIITAVSLSLRCIDFHVSAGGSVSPVIYDYIKNKANSYIADRTEKGQFKAPSAGSVFKNNRDFGKPSGKLIDEAGLKGTKRGGAQIAPWHANFIINTGDATAADIRALVRLAQEQVQEGTGFMLEPEVIFMPEP